MALRTNRRLFEAPPRDEVALAEQARALLGGLGSPPGASQILEISRRSSPDLAASAWYEGLMQSVHGEFARRLERYPPDRVARSCNRVRLLVLPGMFYREHPEVGADGALAIEIAGRFGFDAEKVQTVSTGSVARNARILHERIDGDAEDDIWLISISKGGSDVRHYLQEYPPNPGIRGWIDVAGIPAGAPLADRKLATPLRRVFTRALCGLFGVEYRALAEMRTDHPYWRRENWPAQLEMVHVVPVPLASHIQAKLRPHYRRLLALGPNDGFVPLTDVQKLPGVIYPVWGSDHFLRTPKLSPLLYRLCNYIADRATGPGGEDA